MPDLINWNDPLSPLECVKNLHYKLFNLFEEYNKEDSLNLTEDEKRLVKSYRRFNLYNFPGSIFKWKTSIENIPCIMIPEEDQQLIIDPREI